MKNEIIIDMRPPADFCTACFGTGKLKAMQSMATFNGGSMRGPDKTVKCPYCNGTGFRRSTK